MPILRSLCRPSPLNWGSPNALLTARMSQTRPSAIQPPMLSTLAISSSTIRLRPYTLHQRHRTHSFLEHKPVGRLNFASVSHCRSLLVICFPCSCFVLIIASSAESILPAIEIRLALWDACCQSAGPEQMLTVFDCEQLPGENSHLCSAERSCGRPFLHNTALLSPTLATTTLSRRASTTVAVDPASASSPSCVSARTQFASLSFQSCCSVSLCSQPLKQQCKLHRQCTLWSC